jgi:hypothetical protein
MGTTWWVLAILVTIKPIERIFLLLQEFLHSPLWSDSFSHSNSLTDWPFMSSEFTFPKCCVDGITQHATFCMWLFFQFRILLLFFLHYSFYFKYQCFFLLFIYWWNSHLQSKHSTAWVTPLVPFALIILLWPRLALNLHCLYLSLPSS